MNKFGAYISRLMTTVIDIEQEEFGEARTYYDTNRSHIEKIKMDNLVDRWFEQKRVFD